MTLNSLWVRKGLGVKKRTVPAIIIVALCVTAATLGLIFSESMVEGLSLKLRSLYTGNLLVRADDNQAVIDVISGVEGVLSSDECVMGSGIIYGSEETASVGIKGVASDYFSKGGRSDLLDWVIADTTGSSSNLTRVKIGKRLSEEIGVSAGERAAIMAADKNGVIRPFLVVVEEVFESGLNQLDESIIYADLSWAEEVFGSPLLEILYREGVDEDALNAELYDLMALHVRNVSDWKTLNRSLYSNFEASRQSVRTILAAIIILGAFYTASVAREMMSDERNRIATLKLLGAGNRRVLSLSFLSVFSLTGLGVVIGLVLGCILGLNLSSFLTFLSNSGVSAFDYYLLSFDSSVPWGEVISFALLMAAVSALSVLFELRRLPRVSPMELFS